MNVRRIKLPDNHDDWLAIRRLGITGTDLAAIMGLSPWASAYSVWLDKLGKLPKKEEKEIMAMGKFMEGPIAELFKMRNPDYKVQRVNAILQHKKHDIMLGNIDRLIVRPNREILEIKNVGAYSAKDWGTDDEPDVPQHYYPQIQWYMAVTGIKMARFAALIGGNKLVTREVPSDNEFIEAMIEIAYEFWNKNVLGNEAPAIDGSEYTEELINMMLKGATTKVAVQIPAAGWFDLEAETKAQIKRLEEDQRKAKNNIKALLDASGSEKGVCGSYQATLKYIETNKFDSKKFQKDFPDLYKQYTVQGGYHRLSIKKSSNL